MAYNSNYKRNYRKPTAKFKPNGTIVVPQRDRNWSQYQKDIFDFVANSNENGVIIARAGSGKSTVLEECVRRAVERNPKAKICVVAFNKSIKEAMSERLADLSTVEVSTCHSLGYKLCRKAFKSGQPDTFKVNRIVESIVGHDNSFDYIDQVKDCVSKAKLTLTPLEPSAIDKLMDEFGIDLERGTTASERAEFIDVVMKTMKLSIEQTGVIDFDDMLYLGIVHNCITPMYDLIFVDETQDLNKAQLTLILQSIKPDGRIIAVGDDFQSINQFMCADERSIPTIIESVSAKTLPLSITYRCPKSVVEMVKHLIPDLEAAPNAADGTVQDVSFETAMCDVKPGDFVLSRKNAPLMKICMMLLKRGIPANIQGADFSKGLLWTIKKSKANTVAELIQYVEGWRTIEKKRLDEKGRASDWVDDKAECILAFCESALTLEDVRNNIRRMFDDKNDDARVLLSSVHRAKGSQAKRVFVLADTLSQKNQTEKNIYYVALTRAMSELYMVRGLP